MESESTSFRPRSFWQVIGDSFRTYFTGLAAYLAIAAMVILPMALCVGALWAIGDYAANAADGWSSVAAKWLATDLLYPAGSALLGLLLEPLMCGALIRAAAQKRLGQPVDVGRAFSSAFKRAGRIICAWLILGLLALVLAAVLAGLAFALSQAAGWLFGIMVAAAIGLPMIIYFSVKWLLVPQAVMLEDSGVVQSLSRSSALVAGNWWRAFGVLVVLTAIPSMVAVIIVSVILGNQDSLGTWATVVVRNIFPEVIILPLAVVSQTLLYFDLRARKDQPVPQLTGEGTEVPPLPGPEYSLPAPGARAQRSWRPNPRLALIAVAVAAVLLAAVVPVVLWQRSQAEDSDIRVGVRSLSTGREVKVSGGDLDSIDFTDFAFVVESKGFIEAAAQQNTVRIVGSSYPGSDGLARVRVYARDETLAQFNAPVQYGSYLPPEFEPDNELSVVVEVLDEHRVMARSATGEFPAASQVVLELDYGNQPGYVARLFTQ